MLSERPSSAAIEKEVWPLITADGTSPVIYKIFPYTEGARCASAMGIQRAYRQIILSWE